MSSRHTKPKTYVVITLAILGIVGALLWFDRDLSGTTVEGIAESDSKDTRPTKTTRPEASPGIPPPQSTGEPLWNPVNERSVGKLPAYPAEWSPEGRTLVQVTGAAAAARNWRAGDRLSLPVPQLGETLHPVIYAIDERGGHSRAALGWFTDADGLPRRVIVTVGPTSMFAYIDTPEGTYELAADDRFGWLLPTASMMAGFDFSEPDYILLEEEPVERVAPSGDTEDTGT